MHALGDEVDVTHVAGDGTRASGRAVRGERGRADFEADTGRKAVARLTLIVYKSRPDDGDWLIITTPRLSDRFEIDGDMYEADEILTDTPTLAKYELRRQTARERTPTDYRQR